MGGMYEMFDACNNGCLRAAQLRPGESEDLRARLKGTLLDGRVRLSATAFFSDYTDMQNTGEKVVGVDEDPDSPNFGEPVPAWTTDNLAARRSRDSSSSSISIPWTDGRLFGYLAWLDTSIVDPGSFQDGYACAERIIYGQPECGNPQMADIRGNQLPFAPEYSADAELRASHSGWPPATRSCRFASVHWQSKMWFDILNYDGAHLSQAQDAYAKFNLSLRLNCTGRALLCRALRRQRDR